MILTYDVFFPDCDNKTVDLVNNYYGSVAFDVHI